MFEAFEEFYSKVPKANPSEKAMEIAMTSCSKCLACGSVLYDEEIMAGWTAEDSNLNTRCYSCQKVVVPFLTIRVADFRRLKTPRLSDIITVPYLSPLVLRKELETILDSEGDICLTDPQTVDDHPIIYWNLLWYHERIAVKSHLPSLCFKAKSLNPPDNSQHPDNAEVIYSHHNVIVACKWDNPNFHQDENRPPIYTQWQIKQINGSGGNSAITGNYLNQIIDEQSHSELKPLMQQILQGVQQNDLIQVRMSSRIPSGLALMIYVSYSL